MALRKIVRINEDLCDGCGKCINACPEGALGIIGGKARLLYEDYCDGLGACIGHCPRGAITIEEGVPHHLHEIPKGISPIHQGIPKASTGLEDRTGKAHLIQNSRKPPFHNWPIKLRLISSRAPFLNGSELILAADCTAFTYQPFHTLLLPGRSLVIGCTKFDSAGVYAEKLEEILKLNEIRGITVLHMEVPCCQGLSWAAIRAVNSSGRSIPVKRLMLTLKGEIREVETLG